MGKSSFILLFFVILFSPALIPVDAQESDSLQTVLIGHWTGAFIRQNSYQKFDIQFYEEDKKLHSLQIMEEWYPTYGEFVIPVSLNGNEVIFNTGIGKAILTLDKDNLEMTGEIKTDQPNTFLHLKKVPDPALEDFDLIPLNITNGEVVLSGHLHLPKINHKKTALILVGGRGCNPDETAYNLYAQFLRKYGIAVLAYQKRGTGNSTGNCSLASIDELASDLNAVFKYLNTSSFEFDKIGVLGISAGGWTMTKAAGQIDFDFMISIVGPATSVYEQQMQSMRYGASFYDLKPAARQNLLDYTQLMFNSKAGNRSFKQMSDLLEKSEREDWRKLLEPTDIPENPDEISNLWVRRHSFDPGDVLASFNKPLLAIYGEKDWIVPAAENIARLNNYFKDKEDLLTTVIAHDSEHGMEKEAKSINLDDGVSYWRFYRIAPEVRIEMVRFLRKHDLTD